LNESGKILGGGVGGACGDGQGQGGGIPH
jgi:hypothetical protein